jgi:hypothetical protein
MPALPPCDSSLTHGRALASVLVRRLGLTGGIRTGLTTFPGEFMAAT